MVHIDMEMAFKLHKERFGFEPVITGARFFDGPPIERIIEAIEKGEPYIEPPVPHGVDI